MMAQKNVNNLIIYTIPWYLATCNTECLFYSMKNTNWRVASNVQSRISFKKETIMRELLIILILILFIISHSYYFLRWDQDLDQIDDDK